MSYILTKVAVTVYAGGVVFKDVFDIDFVTLIIKLLVKKNATPYGVALIDNVD